MSRQGTCYKQYEYDSSIPVPKSTIHNKRKRQVMEIHEHEINEDVQSHDQVRLCECCLLSFCNENVNDCLVLNNKEAICV